jgi:hypothetical protein
MIWVAANATGPATQATSRTAAMTIAGVALPPPPPPVVFQVPGMSVVLSLVPGGGSLPVADLAGELVDGAGAGALDAPLAFAPRADGAPPAALDVPGALALGTGAERAQVQEPHPGGEDGEHGQDQMHVHRGSPARVRAGAGRHAIGEAFGVATGVPAGLADGLAFDAAALVGLAVDPAGVPLAGLVPAAPVVVLRLYT